MMMETMFIVLSPVWMPDTWSADLPKNQADFTGKQTFILKTHNVT